jgi:hypothetical protein
LSAPSARAQATFELPPVSDNAALQYWQAFAMLPALDADKEKLLEDWSHAPLDAAATQLLEESHASLMFLKRGAKLRKCDWGLNYEDGVSMHLPYLAKARTLARIAALDARAAFAAGQSDRAHDDLMGVMALARQVGGDYTLISMLVCYAMEGIVIDAVAPHLEDLGASYEKSVKLFESLPPSPRLDHAVLCEKRMATSIIRQLREAEERRPGSWRETLQAILGPGHPDPFKDAQSLDDVIRQTNDFMAVYDELGQLVVLPPEEFDAKFPKFVDRARAANPVADLLLPAMQKVMDATRRRDARMAMLLASIAVVESGPDKLAGIKDPFGDGPFGYRKLENGFELSSKLIEDGKPVTLTVGKAAAL